MREFWTAWTRSTITIGKMRASGFGVVFLSAIVVIAFIVFMERAQRRILIQYPKRQQGNKIFQGDSSHLPLKLNTPLVINLAAARRFWSGASPKLSR